ncbi:hypothetical protein K493DRAFT_310208 [Basidiobolus meristosporus CBS 931.73]|uniref:Uncharacterized protein n=1 Tax=Basidiobolus meristosporus CBS 931.73 TaxID=1314790 RepID=A0A1Y1ZAY1_9FUNG|nr:hypothetical protein K493DRAFT_310208 [Basidiobolus meristosporus CBS 931.73]|eukprot:ORY07473.1 hypothetical protein K493DRAFT_310208 [Basidiobolus meristosporus CBS 931.73]
MEPSKCLIYKIFKSEVDENSSGESSDDKMRINRVIKVNGRQEASDEDFDIDNLSGEDSTLKAAKPPLDAQTKRKPGRPPKRKGTSTDVTAIKGHKTPGKRRKERESSHPHSSPVPELSSDGSVSVDKDVNFELKSKSKHRYNSSPLMSSDEETYNYKGHSVDDRRNKRMSYSPMESSEDERHRSPSKRVKTNIARVGLKKYWIQKYQRYGADSTSKKSEPEITNKGLDSEETKRSDLLSSGGVDVENFEEGDIIVDEPKVDNLDVTSKHHSATDTSRKNDLVVKSRSANEDFDRKKCDQQDLPVLDQSTQSQGKLEASYETQQDSSNEVDNSLAKDKHSEDAKDLLEGAAISDNLPIPSSPDPQQIVEIDVVGDSPETITLRVDNKILPEKPLVRSPTDKSPEKPSFVKPTAEQSDETLSKESLSQIPESKVVTNENLPEPLIEQTYVDKQPSGIDQETSKDADIPSQQSNKVLDSPQAESTTAEAATEPINIPPTKVKLSLKEYQENLRKAQKSHQEEAQPHAEKTNELQDNDKVDHKAEETKGSTTNDESAPGPESESVGANAASTPGKVKISLQEYNLKRKRESSAPSAQKQSTELQEESGADKSGENKSENTCTNGNDGEMSENQQEGTVPKDETKEEVTPVKFEEQADLIPVPKTEYFPVSFPVKDLAVDTTVLETDISSETKLDTASLEIDSQVSPVDTSPLPNPRDNTENPDEHKKSSASTHTDDIDSPLPSPSSVKSGGVPPVTETTPPNPTQSSSYQSKPYDPANPEDPAEEGQDHPKDMGEREAEYYGQRSGPPTSGRRSDSYRPGYRFDFRDARDREPRERDYRDMNMNAAGLPSGPGWSDDRYQRDRMRERDRDRDKDRSRAHKDWASRDSYRRFNGIYRDRDYPFGREGYEVDNRYSGRMKSGSFGVVAPDYRDNRYGGFRANNYPLPPSVPFNGRSSVEENRFKDSSNRDSPYGSPGANPTPHMPSKSLENHSNDKHISSIPKPNQWATVPGSNNTRS